MAEAGGGILVPLSDYASFRLDGRYRYDDNNGDLRNASSFGDWIVTAGIYIPIGAKYKPAPTVTRTFELSADALFGFNKDQLSPTGVTTINTDGLALAAPGAAFAYGTEDAIRDCESRIRSEYGISDLRDATAVQLSDSEKHFTVEGKAKVDGEKHHWTCEVKNRHVTRAEYDGPKPEGMSTAAKLAVGAAAAVAAGVAISEANKHGGESHSSSGAPGPPGSRTWWARGRAAASQSLRAAATPTSKAKKGAAAPTRTGARAPIASPCAPLTGITSPSSTRPCSTANSATSPFVQ
jgi:hypothetical protein